MKDFAESLPNGFDHKIELSGSNLSDGHRQHLAIARARNQDAAIYIFDDRRSAPDFLTESKLRARLGQILRDKTQIVVTQRVTPVSYIDRRSRCSKNGAYRVDTLHFGFYTIRKTSSKESSGSSSV